jgi:hypothetical protein
MALLAFLLGHEQPDAALDALVSEFLPPRVFLHAFTRGFVQAWLSRGAAGEDALKVFCDAQEADAQGWFGELMLASGKTDASALSETEILQDFIRGLWDDFLRRRRGVLPAAGSPDCEIERMRLSSALKHLHLARWHDVQEMVRGFLTRDDSTSERKG